MAKFIKFKSENPNRQYIELTEFLDAKPKETIVRFIEFKEWRFYSDEMKKAIILYCEGFISNQIKDEIISTMYCTNEIILKELNFKILDEIYETYKNQLKFKKDNFKEIFLRPSGKFYRNYGYDDFFINFYWFTPDNIPTFWLSYSRDSVHQKTIQILPSINLMKNMSAFRLLRGYTMEENYELFPTLKIINDSYKLLNESRSL